MTGLLRLVAVLLALFVAWRVTLLGLAAHQDRLIRREQDEDAAIAAMKWGLASPRALLTRADQLLLKQPEQAAQLYRRALRINPGDGQALVGLAESALILGQLGEADALAAQAERVNPARAPVRLRVAAYWLKRQQRDRALENWHQALVNRPGLSSRLFAPMMALAEGPGGVLLFAPFMERPPVWWQDFFDYLAQRAIRTATLLAFYRLRQTTGVALSLAERDAYVRRLMRDGRWLDAYMAWLNGLDANERRQLGQLYNGQFELPIADSGFSWHQQEFSGAELEVARTFGVEGAFALHLRFFGEHAPYRHLYQPLFLDYDRHYRLSGRVRVDRLQGRGGLLWRLGCLDDGQAQLAETRRFLGSTREWQSFFVDFYVPVGCHAQQLRLQSVGESGLDHALTGEIWFDAMSIRTLPPPAAQATGDS